MKNLIGISGKAGAGKDLLYTIIRDLFPEMHWQRVRFADKLKDMVCILLNCDREKLEDREFKETPLGSEWDKYLIQYIDHRLRRVSEVYTTEEELLKTITNLASKNHNVVISKELIKMTPRLLLQLLGTECGRQIIHPNIWCNATMAGYKPKDNWIITDVRFPNEAKSIKDEGGILIRVDRPGFENTGNHLSETALDDYKDFDSIIINDGSIESLSKKVEDFMMELIMKNTYIKNKGYYGI